MVPGFRGEIQGKGIRGRRTCPQGDYSNITGTTAKTADACKELRLTGARIAPPSPDHREGARNKPDRYGIGKWRESKAMPDQYAGDDFDNDLEVRKKVIRAVRSYIGTHPWDQRIPLQINEKPSILFMKQRSCR